MSRTGLTVSEKTAIAAETGDTRILGESAPNDIAEARRLALKEAAEIIANMPMAEITLRAGEMTAGERRTVKAVQGLFAGAILKAGEE